MVLANVPYMWQQWRQRTVRRSDGAGCRKTAGGVANESSDGPRRMQVRAFSQRWAQSDGGCLQICTVCTD